MDAKDSILIAIDIQPPSVERASKAEPNRLILRMCWVIKVANWLNVPLVVTAEHIANTGDMCEEVAGRLLLNTKIYNKMSFGLAAQADILEAMQNTNRKTAVLMSYETDVCITHSTLGWMD
jgi:hypothetical protein